MPLKVNSTNHISEFLVDRVEHNGRSGLLFAKVPSHLTIVQKLQSLSRRVSPDNTIDLGLLIDSFNTICFAIIALKYLILRLLVLFFLLSLCWCLQKLNQA